MAIVVKKRVRDLKKNPLDLVNIHRPGYEKIFSVELKGKT